MTKRRLMPCFPVSRLVTGLGKADGTYLVVRATQTELVLTPKTGFEPEGGDHE
ncbi:MAG: hypothetical protein ACYTBJ_17300 [Planctomycetota bacterium]|jgi:hypothetical protein